MHGLFCKGHRKKPHGQWPAWVRGACQHGQGSQNQLQAQEMAMRQGLNSPTKLKGKSSVSLPGFDSVYFTQVSQVRWDICVGDSAGAQCQQEAPWTWCHPTSPRRDGIWHAAGCRVQLLARAWPLVNCSWAAPACAHSSTSSQHGRAGGLMIMLPNPSLMLKPRSSNVGIPLVHGGHPEGTSSLVATLSVVCSWAQGACRAPGHCQDHCNASTPGTGSSPHHMEM